MKNLHKICDLTCLLAKGVPIALGIWVLAFGTAIAQLERVPLGPYSAPRAVSALGAARVEALSLPFFDDFSTVTSQADTRLWLGGSGVYINNTLATNHPSVNIATFDGLNAQGVPYNFTNEQSQGESDTLTSQPINLGGLSAADSVYLSYYWMARGLGELPDLTDTLRLEFLNRNNEWVAVWKRAGAEFDTLFQQSFIPIRDLAFLHPAFQFRLRAYGRLSGAFDTWHIDYVYLNKNRSVNDRFIKDVAVRKPLTSLLRNYTAMPFRQYFANPVAHTADSVRTDIVNLFNNFNFTSFTFTIYDEVAKREVQRYQEPVSVIIAAQQIQNKSVTVKPLTRPAGTQRMRLRYKFDLLTTDDQNPTIPTVNLRRNDTLSATVDLSDYYAYDDGSAEFGVRMNQRLGRTVVRFTTSVPDTLGGVRMALVPFRRDVSGQAFTIQVWSNRNGRPDQVLYQKSVPVRYGSSRGDFIEYEFDQGVAVSDTFYVGWLQISEEALAVGFDRNSPRGTAQLLSNLSQEWVTNTDLQGSIMIRPFMGGKTSQVITPVEPLPALQVYVYPNPTSGHIRWDNHLINQIDIFSLQGIKIRTLHPANGQQEASVDDLTEGMYLLRITDGVRSLIQKIVIKK